MAEIILTKGYKTIIDDEDFEYLNQWKWCVRIDKINNIYAIRRSKKEGYVYLHRFLLHAPSNNQVDHINGNGLDNRRVNLRLVTELHNHANRRLNKNNKSGYKGVCWDKSHNRWKVSLQANNKTISLGYSDNAITAAKIYDTGAIKYFGEFAHLNFKQNAPEKKI